VKITQEFKEWFEWFYDQRWPNHNPGKPYLLKLLWKVFTYGYKKGHKNGHAKAIKDLYYPKVENQQPTVFERNLMGELVPKKENLS
jgi:hypothetical protein